MKTATDLLNEIEINYASESDRGFYEGLIKEAMEKYAEQMAKNRIENFIEFLKDNHSIKIHDMIVQDYIKYM